MTPTEPTRDRPLDTLLAGFARGTLSAPLHALVASHLAIRPQGRRFVSALEAASAAEIDRIAPVTVPNRDARLAAIFDEGDEPILTAPSGYNGDDVVPYPLARYLGRGLAETPWRTLIPGVKEFRVSDNEDGEATLYWIRGGRKIPSHTHEGSEYTLVLRGAFSDMHGHYARGDIAVADMDVDHQPVADAHEDCFCFAVTDAPLRLTGPIGRIVQKIFRH